MTRRVFTLREAQEPRLLLVFLLIFVVRSLPVNAFPASAISEAINEGEGISSNTSTFIEADNIVTEYPVFQETQTSSSNSSAEIEVVTEGFMVIEEQEEDDDGNQDYNFGGSTENPAIASSTLPMQPPNPEQEEVLRELKKLWDLSEGLSNTEADLKTSLSSIVHLAYARVYIEPDETLMKLKHLLRELQTRILGTETNHENVSTTETPSSSSSSSQLFSSTEPNHLSTSTSTFDNSRNNNGNSNGVRRNKRSYYDDFEEIENIFFANVNSLENSVIPDAKNYYKLQVQNQSRNHRPNQQVDLNNIIRLNSLKKNDTIINSLIVDPPERAVLSSSSASVMSITSTVGPTPAPSPTSEVKKVIYINDRKRKPISFLTPERIKELKDRMKTSTSPAPILPSFGVIINDELENEVNSLQQEDSTLDNFHIQISEVLSPLTTTKPPPPTLPFLELKKTTTTTTERTTTIPTKSQSQSPFTAEEIALALFQLLRPETSYENDDSDEDESSAAQPPHPTPSSILYQVGPLSSIFNLTNSNNNTKNSNNDSAKLTITTPSPPSASFTVTSNVTKIKGNKVKLKNATLLAPPTEFLNLNLGNPLPSSTSTEKAAKPEQDFYDYTDVAESETIITYPESPPSILDVTKDGMQNIVDSVTRLSVGAKIVLLFSISISILSIGFGLYALGPPLAGVGVLGIIIPVGLLILFETSATPAGKKRKLTRQRQKEIIKKLQSEEFSKILDMIFDAVIKYSKG